MGLFRRLLELFKWPSIDATGDEHFRCIRCGAGFERNHDACPRCGAAFVAPLRAADENE